MSTFIRILTEEDKALALSAICASLRQGQRDSRCFEVTPEIFDIIPGKPFAYWVSARLSATFAENNIFESNGRVARAGLQTSDNFRFLRLNWELSGNWTQNCWFPYAKGGAFSPFYSDLNLAFRWEADGKEVKAWNESLYGGGQHWSSPSLVQ